MGRWIKCLQQYDFETEHRRSWFPDYKHGRSDQKKKETEVPCRMLIVQNDFQAEDDLAEITRSKVNRFPRSERKIFLREVFSLSVTGHCGIL